MDKEKARFFLETSFRVGILPIFDCVIYRDYNVIDKTYVEYTFRELLCIAYDLKKKEDED